MPEVFNDIIHNGIPGHSDVLHSSTSVGFPGHCWLPPNGSPRHPRPLTLDPLPQEVEHWDHPPHSCHSAMITAIFDKFKRKAKRSVGFVLQCTVHFDFEQLQKIPKIEGGINREVIFLRKANHRTWLRAHRNQKAYPAK